MRNRITSTKDIGKALKVYWIIVRPNFISEKCISKRIIFFLNPTEEKYFITTEVFFVTSEGNEVFRPRQKTIETLSALEFSVREKFENPRDLLTQKIGKLIPVSHDPRARIPSSLVLVNAMTHSFDEKIPQSAITKLVACQHSTLRCAQNKVRAATYIAAYPQKETHERESLRNSQRSRVCSK